MKYVRCKYKNKEYYGILENGVIKVLNRSYFCSSCTETGRRIPLKDVQLLAPTLFSKALCIGLNYKDHAEEFNLPVPKDPVVFMKASTTVADPDGNIIYPRFMSHHLDYEGELAVVIKKNCHKISEKEAKDYILGYTIANDVTARDLQSPTGQWTVAKGFDTFCPIGPYINTWLDPSKLDLETKVNGVVKQHSNTKNLIFPVPYLVSYLSHVMTLYTGDIILTGTPSGISRLKKGDVVEISIEGLGTLRNTVI
ncbi:MAG: fumarylacetoacetate hydrolase family protein [Sphaerochaetaceae bacterium]|nr:fumarylacetoacetate hydrolase family protein [Sphaerochaetaceae bacterium]